MFPGTFRRCERAAAVRARSVSEGWIIPRSRCGHRGLGPDSAAPQKHMKIRQLLGAPCAKTVYSTHRLLMATAGPPLDPAGIAWALRIVVEVHACRNPTLP